MKLVAFSIKDTKAGFWATPFYVNNHGVAIRAIQEMLEQPQLNEMVKYPLDKELWAIGAYETNTGELTGEKHTLVCNLADFVKAK